ncbi:MAG TPA: hypothetical protein VNC11_13015 [Gemmatimonadaceae bacterium]|jgi:hypothetical protein|nr:hypothetical protein [Gemmatimonadaceae bacterium]
MKVRKIALGAAAGTLIFVACDDSNPFAAQLPTAQDQYQIFALTGNPPAYPSGLNLFGRTPTRVDGNASFDIAFDIDKAGNAIVYPVKLVVSSIGGDRPVGLKKVAGTFASVTSAPTGTYQTDSAVVAGKDQVVVVENYRGLSGDICSFSLSPYIYSKVNIDSVNVVTKTINVTVTVDPNCGFRSFEEGVPQK